MEIFEKHQIELLVHFGLTSAKWINSKSKTLIKFVKHDFFGKPGIWMLFYSKKIYTIFKKLHFNN